MTIVETLCAEFHIAPWQAEAVIRLLDEGCTLPFIARYRKEQHGELDDQKLRDIADRLTALRNLESRRNEIAESLKKLEVWTEDLQAALDQATTMGQLEDIYRPYRPKRRTRAMIAREKGLAPLADMLLLQLSKAKTAEELAAGYVDPEKGVATAEDALQGAMDIIAEKISDDPAVRTRLKALCRRDGVMTTRPAGEEDSVYRMYYDRSEPWKLMPSHRVLAMNRGEKEGFLKVGLEVNEGGVQRVIQSDYVAHTGSLATEYVIRACEDAYTRLIAPSLDTELRGDLTAKAQTAAIRMFAMNLKPLLMQPPVRGRVAMGLDPGIRTGCKVAVVDPTGKVLDTTVVYPTFSERKKQEAIDRLSVLMRKDGVKHIAIGNGTASRETEAMTVELLKSFPDAGYMIVSEAGASVYSASPLAAEEFPDYDVNLRSAVSIARRLQDPLAELVKIDPQAIGVGQYQHDCPQKELSAALGAVVEDCVNTVGVDVNTASRSLLEQVSGLTAATAKNIVAYREENGPFTGRSQLKKVPKLGPKAFEQCAGFLRVPESRELLDNTGVHPESYAAAKALLALLDFQKGESLGALPEKLRAYGVAKAARECGVGEPTLLDIAKELAKPGRDPRDELPAPVLRKDVLEMKDLKPGMILTGTVRNVIDFGVFVDIGVHQDGLVHISEVSKRRLRHPSEAVQVGDVVKVMVLSVDEKRRRIGLSMKQADK